MVAREKTLSVYKYPIRPNDIVELDLPSGAELLKVADQKGTVCMWALVDPSMPTERRKFRMAGTGHPILEPAEYLVHVDSWLMAGGSLVFHLFEIF